MANTFCDLRGCRRPSAASRRAAESAVTALRAALQAAGLSYAEAGRRIGISKAAVARAVRDGHLPRGREAPLRRAIEAELRQRGVDTTGLWAAAGPISDEEEEITVRERLSEAARKHFRLRADPWEVRGPGDVWLGQRLRYGLEALTDAAETGGMLALVGESGSGKSTVRRLFLDRVRREERPVRVVQPLAIDRSRLTAASICDAVVDDLAPTERPRRTLEGKARQVLRLLTESSRAGYATALLIEEAHDLAVQTLKFCKRFWELEDGFSRLLSIVLIAQPEIAETLDSRSWAVREVVRRIEVVDLGMLDEAEIQEFVAARIGGDALADGAAAAIRDRLSRHARRGGARQSTATPLGVANLMTTALNLAAELGQPQVTAATIAAA